MWKKLGGLLVVCLAVGLHPAAAQQAKNAIEVAPDAHRVVLENAYVRVVEVRMGAGQRTPMHSHPARVAVSLGSGRVKFTAPDGKTELLDLRPGGEAVWLEAQDHSKEVLVGTLHVILVEPKGPKPPVPVRKAKDCTEVVPDLCRIVLENPSVRVMEYRAIQGQKVPLHSHPAFLDVNLSPVRWKLNLPDGKIRLGDARPGEVWWSDGEEHAVDHLVGNAHIVSIELKGGKPATR